MRSPANARWPQLWLAVPMTTNRRSSRAAAIIAALALTLMFVPLLSGDMFGAGVALICAIMFAAGGASVYLSGEAGILRTTEGVFVATLKTGRPSMFVPQSRAYTYVQWCFMIAVVPLMLAAPKLAEITDVPSDADRFAQRLEFLAPILPYLLILLAPRMLSILMRVRMSTGIALDSQGVFVWSWYGSSFVRWDWITNVEPVALRVGPAVRLTVEEPDERPTNPEENWLGRNVVAFRKRQRDLQVGRLSANPALVCYAICFYLGHPELRHELGTDAALERMRTCDYPGVIAPTS